MLPLPLNLLPALLRKLPKVAKKAAAPKKAERSKAAATKAAATKTAS